MERKSSAIKKQCMWTPATRIAGKEEERQGKPCFLDSDCPSSQGRADGTCVPAMRAFCPSRCATEKYEIASMSSAPVPQATNTLVAARLLSLATKQSEILALDPKRAAFQPRCPEAEGAGSAVDTPLCYTQAEAEEHVRKNYVLVNIDYTSFTHSSDDMSEEVSYDMLVAHIGGLLALFLGISICSIVQCFELSVFALLSWPLFLVGRGAMCVRGSTSSEGQVCVRVCARVRDVVHAFARAPACSVFLAHTLS